MIISGSSTYAETSPFELVSCSQYQIDSWPTVELSDRRFDAMQHGNWFSRGLPATTITIENQPVPWALRAPHNLISCMRAPNIDVVISTTFTRVICYNDECRRPGVCSTLDAWYSRCINTIGQARRWPARSVRHCTVR